MNLIATIKERGTEKGICHSMFKKRSLIFSFFIILLVVFLFFAKYLLIEHAEQAQSFIRSNVSSKVEERKEELDEVIDEIKNQNCPEFVIRWNRDGDAAFYKDLRNDKITKVFNDFSLSAMINQMDNSEGGYICFIILSHAANLVWSDYDFGFYYSEEDKPINIYMGNNVDSNTIISEELVSFVKFWYRTEKITDNWWYFEAQWSYGNVSPRK